MSTVLASYRSRNDLAEFCRSLLFLWETGRITDDDFRWRLSALAHCKVDNVELLE